MSMIINNTSVIYEDKEIIKMVYYFQNRSLLNIILDWLKLQFMNKISKEDCE